MNSDATRLSVVDLGRNSVRVLVAERSGDGVIRVLGAGQAPSRHFDREIPESVSESIEIAVEAAEDAAGCEIDSLFAGVSGIDLCSVSQTAGMLVTRTPEDRATSVIRREHVENLLERAEQAENLHIDREILHSLPQEYEVDGVPGVHQPLGLHAIRLMCHTHCITAPALFLKSLRNCIHRAGQRLDGLHLSSLALTDFITSDEQELGTLLLDIGAGSTEILLVSEGRIHHTATIPLAGEAITRDIMSAFHVTRHEAERIKQEFGNCRLDTGVEDVGFLLNSEDGSIQESSTSELCQVIQPRMEEILEHVVVELKRAGMQWLLGAGVVITGGGASLRGLPGLIHDVYDQPVRMLHPVGVECVDNQPNLGEWTPVIGLAHRALRDVPLRRGRRPLRSLHGWLDRMRDQVAL